MSYIANILQVETWPKFSKCPQGAPEWKKKSEFSKIFYFYPKLLKIAFGIIVSSSDNYGHEWVKAFHLSPSLPFLAFPCLTLAWASQYIFLHAHCQRAVRRSWCCCRSRWPLCPRTRCRGSSPSSPASPAAPAAGCAAAAPGSPRPAAGRGTCSSQRGSTLTSLSSEILITTHS